MLWNKLKNNIINYFHLLINKIFKTFLIVIDFLIVEDVKKTFLNFKNYSIKKIILFFSLLPFTFIFVIINAIVTLTSLIFYLIVFIFKFIQNRIFKKRVKPLKYVRRFKFLKNFYLIFFEKILITFPKQRAFLIFYICLKSLITKDKDLFNKEIIFYYVKSISNRYVISFIFGLPYIIIYCNSWFTDTVFDLKDYNYETKTSFLFTVCLNVFKDLSNNYNKLLTKLKIKIFKKKIVFNSKKDLIKALKYRKEFNKNFNITKKAFKFGSAKLITEKQELIDNKTINYKYTKSHPTAVIKIDNENSLYLNETSSKSILFLKWQNEIKDYIENKYQNSFTHKGSYNEKKITYFTPAIKSKTNDIIFTDNNINKKFILNLKEEKINNIIAAFSLNLDNNYLESVFFNVNKIDKSKLIENINSQKTIDLIKNNKNSINSQAYESILGMEFFWNENEKIINNLSLEEKINLCIELNLEIDSSAKEINFKIFKDILNTK